MKDEILKESDNGLTFETHGQFKGSFGLDSVFSVKDVNKTQYFSYENVISGALNANSHICIIEWNEFENFGKF